MCKGPAAKGSKEEERNQWLSGVSVLCGATNEARGVSREDNRGLCRSCQEFSLDSQDSRESLKGQLLGLLVKD